MNNRYVLVEKVVKGRKIFRKIPKQSWNALKPGSIGLNGWVESKEEQVQRFAPEKFPELEQTKQDSQEEAVEEAVTLEVDNAPKGYVAKRYEKEDLELMTGKELVSIANTLSDKPVPLQAKSKLIQIILENL